MSEQRGPRGYPPLPPPWVGAVRRPGGSRYAGEGGGASGGGQGLPTMPTFDPPGQLLAFPPDYFPPESATTLLVQGSTTGIAAGSSVVLGTFTLPAAEIGVVRSIALGVGNITSTSDVRFRILVSGMAVVGYGDIRFPPQAAAFAGFSFGPEETRLWLPTGAQLDLVVEVPAGGGGPFDATGTLHGWHWGTA